MSRIYLLGSGTPVPSSDRFGTSFVVEVDGEHLMFDCGPAATHKLVKAGLWTTQVSRLFFTHHHYDHNADYPCFLLNRWDQSVGREPELEVYGPAPTTRFTEQLVGEDGAFWPDIQARVNNPGSQRVFVNRGGTLPRRPPAVRTRDIEPGKEFAGDAWSVRTGWAAHAQPWLDSISYRLESASGSIVFTGDTRPCDEIVDLARDADVLMCMCWDDQEHLDASGEGKFGMSGTHDAARIAQRAGARQLVLVHSHGRVDEPGVVDKMISDIHRIYDGDVIMGREGLALDLASGRLRPDAIDTATSVPPAERTTEASGK